MLRREPTGGTLYHAYAKRVENLDANFTNKMAVNHLQNCNIPICITLYIGNGNSTGLAIPIGTCILHVHVYSQVGIA